MNQEMQRTDIFIIFKIQTQLHLNPSNLFRLDQKVTWYRLLVISQLNSQM
jgi:hypothetical protein